VYFSIKKNIYIYAFSRLFYPTWLTIVKTNQQINIYAYIHAFSRNLSKVTCNRGNKQTNKQTFTSVNLADTYPKWLVIIEWTTKKKNSIHAFSRHFYPKLLTIGGRNKQTNKHLHAFRKLLSKVTCNRGNKQTKVTYNRGRKKKKQLHIYIQETLLSKVTYKLSKKIKIKKFLPA